MPRVNFGNIASIGLIRDVEPHLLPPEAFSDINNMRIIDQQLQRINGHTEVFATPSIAPKWAFPVNGTANFFWLYSDNAKFFVNNGVASFDVTRAVGGDYSATDTLRWNGGLLGGVPILNNSVDDPQFWPALNTGTRLQDLTNWPANTKARIMRPFGVYMFAMNMTENGTEFPHKIRWSNPADPGSIPDSWDVTDPTNDAGENSLTDTSSGQILDAWQLGTFLFVYKDNSTWAVNFIGGRFIFDFKQVMSSSGILTTDCAKALPVKNSRQGSKIFAVTGDDIILHDRQSAESIVEKRWRRHLQRDIDATNYERSFVVINERFNEAWFCYPENGETDVTKAMMYNYADNTITERDLPELDWIGRGVIAEDPSETWDSSVGTWDEQIGTWNGENFPALRDLLLCDATNTKFYKDNEGTTFAGADIPSLVEKTGIVITGRNNFGDPVSNLSHRKLLVRAWIRARGSAFNVSIGGHDTQDDPIDWSEPRLFTPGVDRYVDFDCPKSGVFLAFKLEATGGAGWQLQNYDLKIELLGEVD